ncbi:Mitogen-activated protein kinase kinase kinase 2 [Hondaea fermentalgiana]|uniref:Mitogen-activated protein kinase kinase kinase 2 n=1 Tax=Hondaea fermentalgiana TaxID=2315210 RepID=A0A2R5GEQ4_9STRA|nr:Mitogen-activated protein kinase kinase kinase 2 [Hondaea fermentalgiana]|eukprot:GBG28228.1 Mitogen-activated protein kinase kinase kinase 2 [Hondaea fermentalgiana]
MDVERTVQEALRLDTAGEFSRAAQIYEEAVLVLADMCAVDSSAHEVKSLLVALERRKNEIRSHLLEELSLQMQKPAKEDQQDKGIAASQVPLLTGSGRIFGLREALTFRILCPALDRDEAQDMLTQLVADKRLAAALADEFAELAAGKATTRGVEAICRALSPTFDVSLLDTPAKEAAVGNVAGYGDDAGGKGRAQHEPLGSTAARASNRLEWSGTRVATSAAVSDDTVVKKVTYSAVCTKVAYSIIVIVCTKIAIRFGSAAVTDGSFVANSITITDCKIARFHDGTAAHDSAARERHKGNCRRQATRAPPQHHYLGAASRPQTLPAVFDALTVEMPSSESLEYAAPVRSPGGLQGLAPSPSSASNLSALAAQAKETSRQRHASSRVALGETPRSMTTSSARPWSAATGAGPRRLPTLQATSPKAPSSPSRAPSQAPLGDGYGMYCEPWRREKVIGQGQFGVVYKAVNLRSGEKLAVKQVRIVSIAMLEQMIDEVVLMCRASFRNQNVVQSLGWSITDEMSQEAISAEEQFGMPIHSLDGLDKAGAVGKMFNIFMEFVERGSIASVLEREGAMSESTMRVYMRQLLLGLRSLHAAGIAHRDIKCQNLLLSSDYTLKVADFGSAKKVADHTTGPTSSIQGSIPWMSPEVIRQEVGKVSNNHAAGDGSGGGGEVAVDEEAVKLAGWKLADVWSVGCTMVEMVTGRPPWNNYSNPAAMMFAIASANSAPALQEGLLHPDGVDFLHQCCQIDPHRRPLVAKLAYHPYMRPENVDADGNYAPRASPAGGDDDDDDDDDNE